MRFPFVDGTAKNPPSAPLELPVPERQKQTDPAGYLMESRLVDAINVALVLSQPLLLTGEPGTGKTQLAHRLAWELGYGAPLVFNTKSTSTARDLFYTFDTMGRFHAAQTREGSSTNLDYMSYNALGLAILLSRLRADILSVLPPGFVHVGPRRAVVLIDEIDKAPRDFPNDLLHEVDAMAFRIPQLGNVEVQADRALRPVLVLTSNSEKNLPDAFLRRCVFFNIPFPGRARLTEIVQARLSAFRDGTSALLDSGLDFFLKVREQNLRKPPSTAELINWLQVMVEHGAPANQPLKSSRAAMGKCLSTLAKNKEDVDELAAFVDLYFSRERVD
ncbi:MAG: MoxR family ATPase [Betaproteobacteria bacterium]